MMAKEKRKGLIRMRKVIDGKVYDTETAEQIATDSFSNYGDLTYWSEALYRTQKGNWFLCGEGGALTKYARGVGQNEIGGGSAIIPLTRGKALSWLEAHTPDAEVYEKYFTDVVEDA